MSPPKIRRAKLGDIPAIVSLIEEMHQRSRFAGEALNHQRARALVMQSIQRGQGEARIGATYVAVADTGKEIEGFILGIVQPLYMVLDVPEATDVFWYARTGANAATANRLMCAFHRWAPAGAVIRDAVTDTITDPKRSGRVLQHRGMRLVGFIYETRKEG